MAHDEHKAQRAIQFIQCLKHTKGEFHGKPFNLLPWQKQIISDVFGTVREEDPTMRQYTSAYIEIAKKQGKSELGAAVALNMLVNDDEWKAEVYSCASDRQQAGIVFDVAADMVRQSPALARRIKIIPSTKRMVFQPTGSIYQVLSSEVACLRAGAVVQLQDGTIKHAEDVVAGDILLSYNGLTPVFDEVVSVEEQRPAEILEITTHHNRKTCVTTEHPFYRMERGRCNQGLTHQYDWMEAECLQKDDRLAVALGWPSSFVVPTDAIMVEEAYSIGTEINQSNCSKTQIPDAVWKGGPAIWSAFLAGYMDTDGCVTNGDCQCASICSVSSALTEGCQVLLARLGINASTIATFKVNVSGKPQLRLLWKRLSPYMVHPRKRKRLQEAAETEILCVQRSSESDKVVNVRSLGKEKTYSFEMRRYNTHATDGLITHNTKHGLNVSACIFDELHTQPTRKLYDVMTQGSGDARKQPLFFFLTTAGTDRNSICWEVHQKALDILEGRKRDPRFYPVVFGLPDTEDWKLEENWYKANPSLGHTIGIDKVRDAYRKALESPADENMFRQLRLNQWVKQSIRWMPMDKWDECGASFDESILEGRACYAGLDLASTSDLTTIILVFPPENDDEPYYVLPFFWLPDETLELRVRRDHVMYDVWEKQDFIQTTEGNVVHYGFIQKAINDLGERFNIREIAYDRWNATMMVQALEDDGFTMIPFGQGFRDMSPPTKELMRLVLEHRIAHGGHPVLRWNMDNAYVKTDPAGNQKIDKSKSTEKVDGAVAMVMALDRAMKNQSEGGSVYDDDRGLLFV